VLCSLFCVAAGIPSRLVDPTALDDSAPAVSNDMINRVNSRQTTWTAGQNAKFAGMTIGQAKVYMGTILGGRMPPAKVFDEEDVSVPDSFDARTAWSQCPSINLVRDQSACGSCWAFGAVEAFNDRLCIANGSQIILAAADVLACCSACGYGCNGGYPQSAWSYFVGTGDVNDDCFKYPFPACAHHVVSPDYPPCPSAEYNTPKCPRTCSDGSSFAASKVRAKRVYSISGETNIMKEVSTSGPVTAAFTVYEDFLSYKSGVYQYTTGSFLGGHAVEILGYGVENGVKYWIVKNSWNPSWGDKGYFKMIRGTNDCGIEGQIVAGSV